MDEFTPVTLTDAIQKLFELNNYEVEGPIQLCGAEIDLVARPKADPFGTSIYIEATVEYVNNDKYGKDVGKLALVAVKEPSAMKLIVSSNGFSLPVKERAKETGIETLTYNELFNKFERFEPYVTFYLGESDEAKELKNLSEMYEEANFSDSLGNEVATSFLTNWKNNNKGKGQWILITGEYGTGKTALTKVLQYRWLNDYQLNPNWPLPLRIELREFASQFNERGLLHHFLDHNNLSHIPIDFVITLIRSGRIILLLDGYDEMAQYLHTRERRACLEALANLSAEGAIGIITSRPNYFTETEELQVFEILYKSLEHSQYFLGKEARVLLEKEKQVDKLLEQFIDRYERILKDLSPSQTESLINRVLAHDPKGRDIVNRLLRRIFRSFDYGDDISLSGKPVIVSYLLEVIEGLKETSKEVSTDSLTEWQIYKLIVDQLMLRDFKRSPEIHPQNRRIFLQKLAIFLSKREHPVVQEEDFRDMVSKEFSRQIKRLPSEAQSNHLEQIFSDLRSSTTLTRGGRSMYNGWRYSHNSLREFLVAEHLISKLEDNQIVADSVVISEAMKIFSGSIDMDIRRNLIDKLSNLWRKRKTKLGFGSLLALLWEGLYRLYPTSINQREACLKTISGDPPQLSDIKLGNIVISVEDEPCSLENADFSNSQLYDVSFNGALMKSAVFTKADIESVNFQNSDLREAIFCNSFIVEADFSGALIDRADFTSVNPDAISIILENDGPIGKRILEGFNALGYLSYQNAVTDELPPYYIYQHHHAFPVFTKIIEKLAQQSLRQRRGLVQRGAAQRDAKSANAVVKHLESTGLIYTPKNRKDLVEVTDRGRKVFSEYIGEQKLESELLSFFLSKK